MPNSDNQPHDDSAKKANGHDYVQPTAPQLTIQQQLQQLFSLEDFSQRAINNGQQKINYEFTVAGKKLSEALRLLTAVLVAKGCCTEQDLTDVNDAIAEASRISNTVADIFPPGCPTIKPRPDPA
jgi:hypothetical protein